MADSVALNEVVRVLGTELGKNDERVLIGSTEEEKEVLQKHASAGKRRAVMGFIAGSSISAGVWKSLGGQRRFVGGLTMASGGMAGFMYGMLSIRRGLFEDILTLPSDKSPFAHRARQVLDVQLPNNKFYLEVKQQLKHNEGETGSWDAVPASTSFQTSIADDTSGDFRGFSPSTASSSSSSRMPRLPSLPQTQTDDAFSTKDSLNENDAEPSSPSSTSSSPFFFGGSASRNDSADSFRGSSLPTKKKPLDDDPYYNDGDRWGDDNIDKINKPKPVTWEELRRRAASGKQ